MTVLTKVFVTLTALEFFYIFYLETIATTSDRTAAVFGIGKHELARDSVNVLFKNQGVYNAVIGAMLLVATYCLRSGAAVVLFLVNIIVVAAYGAVSSNPKILPMQGGLAAASLVLLLAFGL